MMKFLFLSGGLVKSSRTRTWNSPIRQADTYLRQAVNAEIGLGEVVGVTFIPSFIIVAFGLPEFRPSVTTIINIVHRWMHAISNTCGKKQKIGAAFACYNHSSIPYHRWIHALSNIYARKQKIGASIVRQLPYWSFLRIYPFSVPSLFHCARDYILRAEKNTDSYSLSSVPSL
jgi:hypothetical protein